MDREIDNNTNESSTGLEEPSLNQTDEDLYSEKLERPTTKKHAKKRKHNAKATEKLSVSSETRPPASSSAQKRSRLKGKLARMMEMPVDIFTEIAKHLTPHDLLRLARSTKRLREVLMSKQAKPIWNAAEKAAGLPDCPCDMSSPQLASFLYDYHCMQCHKTRGKFRLVSFRMRICKTCKEQNVKKGSWIHINELDEGHSQLEVYALVPRLDAPGYYRHIALNVNDDEEMLFHKEVMNLSSSTEYSHYRDEYYEPQLLAAFRQYCDLQGTRADQKMFVMERLLAVKKVHEGAPALAQWIANRKETSVEINARLRKERSSHIIEKLEELGYTSQDFSRYYDEKDWKWTCLMNQPRRLTDKAWNSIRPQLQETIRLRREARGADERRERVQNLKEEIFHFSRSTIGKERYISDEEILDLPLVEELISRDDAKYKISDNDKELLQQELLALNETQKKSMLQRTAAKLSQARTDSGLDNIPTNICHLKEDIDEALVLHPTSLCQNRYGRQMTYSDALSELFSGYTSYIGIDNHEPASPTRLLIANILHTSTANNFKTVAELNSVCALFVCLRCHPLNRCLLSWKNLIEHFHEENVKYQKREAKRLESSDEKIGSIVNTNNHDLAILQKLAFYTGIGVSDDASEWVEKCECGICIHRLGDLSCRDCSALSEHREFNCNVRLNGHRISMHTQQTA